MKNQLSTFCKFFAFLIALFFFFSCKNNTKKTSAEASPAPIVKKETSPAIEKINRFLSEIQRFDSLDQVNGLTNNSILFTGSSSIRMWSTLSKDMSPLPVLNRGFGGATIPEILHFSGKYIFQHNPQIIAVSYTHLTLPTTPYV